MEAIVVSRNEAVRSSLQLLLEIVAGCEVRAAADCEAAQALVRNYQPDVVLVDGYLPEESILCLLAEVERVAPRAMCVVVQAAAEQRAALKLAGAEQVFPDGDGPGKLIDLLEGLAARSKAARADTRLDGVTPSGPVALRRE